MAKTEELIMTCLAYETLFDDYLTIDIKSVASSIPYPDFVTQKCPFCN